MRDTVDTIAGGVFASLLAAFFLASAIFGIFIDALFYMVMFDAIIACAFGTIAFMLAREICD